MSGASNESNPEKGSVAAPDQTPTAWSASIRTILRPTHDRLEQTAFAKALMAGALGRESYLFALSQLSAMHEAVERHLSNLPEVGSFLEPRMRRYEAIQRDFAALGGPVAEPIPETRALVDRFSTWATESPWCLIGALYVFEGSRMGSSFLYRPLAASLGVEEKLGTGIDYHFEGSADQPRHWKDFKAKLEVAVPTSNRDDVITGACETMDLLYRVYDLLPV